MRNGKKDSIRCEIYSNFITSMVLLNDLIGDFRLQSKYQAPWECLSNVWNKPKCHSLGIIFPALPSEYQSSYYITPLNSLLLTQVGAMRVPPQKCLAGYHLVPSCREANHGHAPGWATNPLTTRDWLTVVTPQEPSLPLGFGGWVARNLCHWQIRGFAILSALLSRM